MKMSADYAHWENGRLSGPPGPLPNVWREYAGIHQFTDDQLAAIGWFPVERSCPKCAKNLAYRLDEDRQVIVAYVPQEEIERTKAALRSINERMMEQPQHFGFLSDALGMPHAYSAAPHFFFPAIAAGIVGAPVHLWCREDRTGRGCFLKHTPDQVADVLMAYLSHYHEIVVPHVSDALGATNYASTTEEVEDAHKIAVNFLSLWPGRSGIAE